jgi:GNAT superfamily N-acetyltransferase
MQDILIRSTMPKDAEGLIAHWIAIASEPDILVPYTPEEANACLEKQRANITKDSQDGNLALVAEADGEIIADFLCRRDSGFTMTRHTASIGMSVERRYRNQGIGTRLMHGR